MTGTSVPRRAVRAALPVALIGALVSAGVAAHAGTAAAATKITVTVHTGSSGTVGTGFAGFSYEKDRIGAGMFDPADTALVNLFRLLGPSVLRVGGNLVDIVKWNPAGKGGSAGEVTPADVTKFAAFVKAAGWKVIYGINLKTNTAANAAAEAKVAAQALGGSLVSFEIGNEPNVYRTESTYETSFNAYVKAIRAKVPGAVFDGPDTYDNSAWMSPFAQHEKKNALAALSVHTYIGDNKKTSISGMLASNTSGKFPALESTMQQAASANGIPQWRMTEANSYFHGGAAGVSDVEAASLWSLDFMYGIASHHGAGVNFHGGFSTQFPLHYTPIVFNGLKPVGVQGVYYGELLWALAGAGTLHTATVSGAGSVTAWGVGDNVIVNNKGTAAVSATVTLPAAAGQGSVYLLTAPSLDSTAVTVAGSAVSAGGGFTPAPQAVTVSGTRAVLTVPAHSAALLVTH